MRRHSEASAPRGVTRANLREVCIGADRRGGRLVCLVRRYGFWGLLGVFLFALAVAALPPRASADGPWCRVPPVRRPLRTARLLSAPGIRWHLVLDAKHEEEKRVVAALYNRYCIRCHGVDGRGVWDIPDVPDFTNAHWQASRCDARLAEIILEGRGAVMPPFRGTLSLEEGCAMGRYLRTFAHGATTPAGFSAAEGGQHQRSRPQCVAAQRLRSFPCSPAVK